jgi:hypothetical protein
MGNFIPIVQTYKDTYISVSHRFKQKTQRQLVQPDIIFGAADLTGTSSDIQFPLTRSPKSAPRSAATASVRPAKC